MSYTLRKSDFPFCGAQLEGTVQQYQFIHHVRILITLFVTVSPKGPYSKSEVENFMRCYKSFMKQLEDKAQKEKVWLSSVKDSSTNLKITIVSSIPFFLDSDVEANYSGLHLASQYGCPRYYIACLLYQQ